MSSITTTWKHVFLSVDLIHVVFNRLLSEFADLSRCSPSSHRNVMMRLNLQLTMGTFSLSLFGLMGVAFGMNLESSLEEVRMYYFNML